MKTIDHKYRSFVRSLGCMIGNKDCFGDICAHHVKTKGAGWGDYNNLVPLCINHHTHNQGIHVIGKIRFEEKYSLQLEGLASSIFLQYKMEASK